MGEFQGIWSGRVTVLGTPPSIVTVGYDVTLDVHRQDSGYLVDGLCPSGEGSVEAAVGAETGAYVAGGLSCDIKTGELCLSVYSDEVRFELIGRNELHMSTVADGFDSCSDTYYPEILIQMTGTRSES